MVAPVALYAGLQAGGAILGFAGSRRAKKAQQREARRRLQLAQINAQRRVVSGQQAAFEEERQARLAESRALAVAAASGASASKGNAPNILADIGAEGAYRAALQVYEAGEDAKMIRAGGEIEASTLRAQARATSIAGAADLLTAGGSLLMKYGGGGPGSGTDTGED